MDEGTQQTGQGTAATPPTQTPPVDPPTDWEARFKGLQRIQAQKDQAATMAQADIDAKQNLIDQLTTDVNTLKGSESTLRTNYEKQLAETRNQANTLEQTLNERVQQLESLSAKVEKAEKKQALRTELTQQHPDMIGWFESGNLNLFDEGGEILTGDALNERVNGFKAQLGQHFGTNFQAAMAGSTPTQSTVPTSTLSGDSEDQLQAWLTANPGHADYDKVSEQYTATVEKRLMGQSHYDVSNL